MHKNMQIRPGAAILLGFVALALASPPGAPADTRAIDPPPTWPRWIVEAESVEPTPGVTIAAQKGTLTVLQDRTRPEAGEVHLPFLRLPSTAPQPGAPILYLAGGPGDSAVEALRGPLFSFLAGLRGLGDVLALDARGAGGSSPSLMCRESWQLPTEAPLDLGAALAMALERSRSCAAFLRASGIDLSAFQVHSAADDIADLARALQIERFRLVAVSYGTRLALEVMRRHPEVVESAALFGVQGPGQGLRLPARTQSRLAQMPAPWAPSPEPGGAATLLAGIEATLARLDQQPARALAPEGPRGDTRPLVIGRGDLQLYASRRLNRAEDLEALARSFSSFARGDFQAAAGDLLRQRKGWLGRATPFLYQCASNVPAERRERVESEGASAALGRLLDFPLPEICAAWQVPALPASEEEPVRSGKPVLLVSGTLDLRTPIEDAREVAAGLPQSQLLVLRGAGHGLDLFLASPRILEITQRFLRQGRVSAADLEVSAFPPSAPTASPDAGSACCQKDRPTPPTAPEERPAPPPGR
jgi:pimeloyl-ACP methyl ester carboxylesterase